MSVINSTNLTTMDFSKPPLIVDMTVKALPKETVYWDYNMPSNSPYFYSRQEEYNTTLITQINRVKYILLRNEVIPNKISANIYLFSFLSTFKECSNGYFYDLELIYNESLANDEIVVWSNKTIYSADIKIIVKNYAPLEKAFSLPPLKITTNKVIKTTGSTATIEALVNHPILKSKKINHNLEDIRPERKRV